MATARLLMYAGALVVMLGAGAYFAGEQDRVGPARARVTDDLLARSKQMGGTGLPKDVFLRAFKAEAELEVWARFRRGGPYALFNTYPIAAQSGGPGPKRKEGDRQVPEGFYRIEGLNPKSQFHLSLRVDYPNASDRKRSDPKSPGSDIYIHGGRASIGCLAMTDPLIEELYVLVAHGWPKRVELHLFPTRMTSERIASLGRSHPSHAEFWAELAPAFAAFEETRKPPKITVDRSGRYSVERVP
ncbi:MAG: L,D-transpeptidase family protein [Methanoregulaceae archaeon]|nr:L,D-transpeptidase family protein [Methanoregulaceae archaeon]